MHDSRIKVCCMHMPLARAQVVPIVASILRPRPRICIPQTTTFLKHKLYITGSSVSCLCPLRLLGEISLYIHTYTMGREARCTTPKLTQHTPPLLGEARASYSYVCCKHQRRPAASPPVRRLLPPRPHIAIWCSSTCCRRRHGSTLLLRLRLLQLIHLQPTRPPFRGQRAARFGR